MAVGPAELLLWAGAFVRFVLHNRRDLHESLHVVGGHATADGFFEIGEMAVHTPGDLQPLGRGCNHERPAILRADLSRDEAASREPVENARQRGALVREAAMELGDRRRRRRREQGENVPLALRQAVVTQIGQIEADPVRRSVNEWDEAQGHVWDGPPE